MRDDVLGLLRDRIDLRRVPFTDAQTRLLLYHDGEDGFRLALAEYERPPEETVVLSGLRLTDADGTLLPTTVTTFPDHLACETPLGIFRCCLAGPDGLSLLPPMTPWGVVFTVPAGRNLVIRREMDARLAVADDGSTEARVRLGPSQDDLAFRAPSDESWVDVRPGAERSALDAARERWRVWFAAAPEVDDPFRAHAAWAWRVLGGNTIRPRSDPRWLGVAPSKVGYVAVWNWDSCFHALALRHLDPELARDQMRLLLAHQRPDGQMPDVIHDGGVLATMADLPPNELAQFVPPGLPDPERDALLRTPITKPPLLAWTVAKIDASAPDDDFLAEVYRRLVRAHDWWWRETDRDGDGLCAYDHPYSSGLDDSPIWDGGAPVTAPELNAYLVLDADALSGIATRLGWEEESARFRSEAERVTRRLLDLLWDDEAGLFWPTRRGKRIRVRTPFSLMPLLTGRLPRPVAERLVANLTDPATFWPRYPVPTVALDDPTFDPNRMWRGPVWMNVNLLLAEGLRRSGYAQVADRLGARTLAMATTQPDFSEYANPLTGAPPPRASPLFSWSAAAFIEFALAARGASASAADAADPPGVV